MRAGGTGLQSSSRLVVQLKRAGLFIVDEEIDGDTPKARRYIATHNETTLDDANRNSRGILCRGRKGLADCDKN